MSVSSLMSVSPRAILPSPAHRTTALALLPLAALGCALAIGGCLDRIDGQVLEHTEPEVMAGANEAEEGAIAGRLHDACLMDEDCAEGLVCGVDCDDSCDQREWPNECCSAACTPRNAPWSCYAFTSVAAGPCPEGTVAPRAPEDWLPESEHPGGLCCLPDHCLWGSRTMCEASSACRWRVATTPERPNDGTCEVDGFEP